MISFAGTRMPVSFFRANSMIYIKNYKRRSKLFKNEIHFLEAFQTYLLNKVASDNVTMDRDTINTILEDLGTNFSYQNHLEFEATKVSSV